jgi:hypothetical protein
MVKRTKAMDAKMLFFNNITQFQEPDSGHYSTKGKTSAIDPSTVPDGPLWTGTRSAFLVRLMPSKRKMTRPTSTSGHQTLASRLAANRPIPV